MASRFSTAYDSLRSALSATFSTKTEIPYPYSLQDNPFQFIVNGYGLKIGSGSSGELENLAFSSSIISFSVILTREVVGFSSVNTSLNTNIKNLYDDMTTIKSYMLDNERVSPMYLGEEIKYISDSGIQEILNGKQRFIFIEVNFSIDITQQIVL